MNTARRRLALLVWSFLTGFASLAAALAGVATAPAPDRPTDPAAVPDGMPTVDEVLEAAGVGSTRAADLAKAGVVPGRTELSPEEARPVANAAITAPRGNRLPQNSFLVGAARVSITPTPEPWDRDGHWQRKNCSTYGVDGDFAPDSDHLLPSSIDDIRGWPAASPNCVYLGGFGLGPVRPAERVGYGGVWVRALAVSNGQRTMVYAIADAVGWFARYDASVCADCGILDVRERLSGDLDTALGNVVVASTHSHASADTYGGWGGIPDWYRAQLRDSAIAAGKQAVANLRPAAIRVGETQLRNRSNQRRDFYYSTVDTGATWLQAVALDGSGVIATMSTFAAHPTIVGDPVLHADWPGATARRFEALYGGVGLLFEGGLGNASVSGVGGDGDEATAENTGIAIADDIARAIGLQAHVLPTNDLVASVQQITHPAMTNPGLVTLGTVGLFDREFTPLTDGAGLPQTYRWSKQDETGVARSCVSTGATVVTIAGAHRIGDMVIAFAPGEIFSNIAEVVKEEIDSTSVTMVMGQANDALGYIIQSFEFDLSANPVTQYGTKTGEYEEVFSIDHCFGDHVLDVLLGSSRAVLS